MRYEVSDLMREIRIVMDQNMSSEQLTELGDVDTLSVEDIIRSKIADAARVVELNAPAHLLDSGKAFATAIEWRCREGVGSGSVQLPDDFMRLISFRMSDWCRAVTVAIDENNPLYALQSSRFPGIRGCPQNPVVAVINEPVGPVLEFYSCTAGEGTFVKRARYLAIPEIEEDGIDVCEKLKPAVVYYAAYLAALSLKDGDAAVGFLNISKELMS